MEDQRKEERTTNETRDLVDERLTQEVLARFENSKSPRLQEIMQSLVKHLHAFVREVELTEEEWSRGIDFLTRTGQISDDKRQEFILLSDVLGVSMLVVGINNRKPPEATESTVFGPFFVEDSPRFERHEPCTAPDGTEMDVPFYTMNYDMVLVPEASSGNGAARTAGTSEE